MSTRVLIPIADGSEDIESVTLIDVLRRAQLSVTVASVMSDRLQVECARGTRIIADRSIRECVDEDWDLVAIPGGLPGADHLHDCPELTELLRQQRESGRGYAAVCAAPARVLGRLGLLEGRRATCYPGFESDLPGGQAENSAVVVDGPVVTSRGPGTAMDFALTLVDQFCGEAVSNDIASAMLFERRN